jgi:hypothetical protein
VQPLRKSYAVESVIHRLQQNGLQVMRTITQQTEPAAPLGGSHVVIFIAGKRPHRSHG